MEMLKNYGSWVSLQSTSITEPGKKKMNIKKFHYKKLLTFTTRIYVHEVEYRIQARAFWVTKTITPLEVQHNGK